MRYCVIAAEKLSINIVNSLLYGYTQIIFTCEFRALQRTFSLVKNTLVLHSFKWISGIQPDYLFQLRSNPIGDDRCNDSQHH